LSEKYAHNSTYAFSENKVIGHIELEGLESVSAIVLGKAQNTWTGITNTLSGVANTANSYLNRGGNAISNALSPVDGIAFYLTINDIKGKGSGKRQSQYPTGPMVEIDAILGTADVATADPSKARIGGATVLGKIISVMEMMKEALGFGQFVGDAVEALKPDVKKIQANQLKKQMINRMQSFHRKHGIRLAMKVIIKQKDGHQLIAALIKTVSKGLLITIMELNLLKQTR
jgi:hypothetical protein